MSLLAMVTLTGGRLSILFRCDSIVALHMANNDNSKLISNNKIIKTTLNMLQTDHVQALQPVNTTEDTTTGNISTNSYQRYVATSQ